MREIIDGLYTWSRMSEPHGYHFNGYFLRHSAGNLVIDPVEPEASVLEHLAAEGVARILITNRNHSRAANKLREATGARTAIHPLDADHASAQGCIIDEGMEHGEVIGPLVVVPADGKSPGEVALHCPTRQSLFVGDAAIGNPPGRCSLLPEEKLDDPARLRESLRDLLALDFDCLLVGDGTPILEGAKAQLEDLVASFQE
jgi:glyoxylase-like metal-dependent hydrolase (beta-lactamase superfamily II)